MEGWCELWQRGMSNLLQGGYKLGRAGIKVVRAGVQGVQGVRGVGGDNVWQGMH